MKRSRLLLLPRTHVDGQRRCRQAFLADFAPAVVAHAELAERAGPRERPPPPTGWGRPMEPPRAEEGAGASAPNVQETQQVWVDGCESRGGRHLTKKGMATKAQAMTTAAGEGSWIPSAPVAGAGYRSA